MTLPLTSFCTLCWLWWEREQGSFAQRCLCLGFSSWSQPSVGDELLLSIHWTPRNWWPPPHEVLQVDHGPRRIFPLKTGFPKTRGTWALNKIHLNYLEPNRYTVVLYSSLIRLVENPGYTCLLLGIERLVFWYRIHTLKNKASKVSTPTPYKGSLKTKRAWNKTRYRAKERKQTILFSRWMILPHYRILHRQV